MIDVYLILLSVVALIILLFSSMVVMSYRQARKRDKPNTIIAGIIGITPLLVIEIALLFMISTY